MFGFLLKKSFFDFWDHLFVASLLNLGFIVIGAYTFMLPSVVPPVILLQLAITISGVFFAFLYAGGVSYMMYDATGGGRHLEWKNLWGYIKATLGKTLRSIILLVVLGLMIFYTLPFYASMNGILPTIAATAVFWMIVFFIWGFQFYMPLYVQASDKKKPVLKRAFLFFMDNTLFSIAVFFVSGILLLLSLFTAFLIPGPAGVFHFQNEALKLRMKKYDYIEEFPEEKKIPWSAVLMKEKEDLGERTLKNLIFPWKD